MRTFVKYAAVGFAGYLVGFYEMKYKAMKVLVEAYAKKESNDSSEQAKEGEEEG